MSNANNIHNLKGLKTGFLTVISLSDERCGKLAIWKCQCVCGMIVKRSSRQIKGGVRCHCGCQRNTSEPPHDAPPGSRWIPLTRGQFALVDDSDYGYFSKFKWTANACGETFYAYNIKLGKMHRLIAGAGIGQEVDHRDGNSLNNRRSNLRLCNSQQNGQNKKLRSDASGRYKGLRWRKNRWECYIEYNGKSVYLGRFRTDTEAAKAYDSAAIKYYGQFARLNLPCA